MSKTIFLKNRSTLFALCAVAFCTAMLTGGTAGAETRILFGSDIHLNAAGLQSAVSQVCTQNLPCETTALVGDYNTSYSNQAQSTTDDINNLLSILPPSANRVLSGGNHDVLITEQSLNKTGLVTESLLTDTSKAPLSPSTMYDMWVINFPDFAAFGDAKSSERKALNEFLTANPDKVLFILSHFPLHTIRDGMETEAESFFSFLNSWGETRDIVYLWGHNHHSGYDTNVNFVARPGDQICGDGPYNNETVCDQTLTFTYLNAGYITEGSYSVVALTGGNIQVYRNDVGYNLGDVNHDTIVSINDALLIAQYYVGLNPANFDPDLADVDDNGIINIVDAMIVAQYYTGIRESLPVLDSNLTVEDGVRFFFGE